MMKPLPREIPLSEILNRGVTHCIEKDHLEKALSSGKKLRVKLGMDPTASNIHIGNAVPLWKLRCLQEHGHQVVFIVGDFTAQIGDTSDKTAMRQALTPEVIEENMKNWKEQAGEIIDLDKIEFVYNSSWLGKMSFSDVTKLAMHFTVAQMIERENYMTRYKEGKPIGLHEFLYPLMQGYDSIAVKADLELGGNDQLFNILAGRHIQEAYGEKPQDVMTFELLEGTDGRKMSKSYGNVINITDEPSDMFGKIMSMKDELITRYFQIATFATTDEITSVEKRLKAGENPRDIKAELATTITALYHGEDAAAQAREAFDNVFRDKQVPTDMEVCQLGEPSYTILDLLMEAKLCPSKSEAKRLITQGGVYVDSERVDDTNASIDISQERVIKVGKKTFLKVVQG